MFTTHQIFVQKKPVQKCFVDQNFFICQSIFKIFAAQLDCIKKVSHCKISMKNHYQTLVNTLRDVNISHIRLLLKINIFLQV